MKWSLPALALRRPIGVIMLVLCVVGLGLIAVNRTPVEFLPPMDLPFLGAFIPYIGATPEQVEREIAIPAEGLFRTLPNLRRVRTTSDANGCFVSLFFEWGTDMTDSLAEVRDRMERLRSVLPEDADRIFVRHFSLDTIPVMQIGLSSKGDPIEFASLVEREIVPKILRLKGVANIDTFGQDEMSLMLDLDQNALLNHGISIYDLVGRLRTSDVNVGVGELIDGDRKFLVRAKSELNRPEDYAALNIGGGMRLKDVASGRLRTRDPDYVFSIDGDRQIFLLITKDAQANTVETCESVVDELDRILASPSLEGTERFIFFSQGEIIEGALNGLFSASKFGGLMALLILFVFLRRVRATILVALAIPGSLVTAFVIMFAIDMSLNLITMMSLIVAVGMVVDNSIVVIENIYRYRAMGYAPEESARRGASEVALAIVAATSTTAVVFIPVLYLQGGQMEVFTRHFAVPVTVSLGASLLIALTLIPLAVSRFREYDRTFADVIFRRRRTDSEAAPRVRDASKSKLLDVYAAILRFALSRRVLALAILIAIVAASAMVPARRMGYQNLPSADRRLVEIDIDLDPNFDLAMASTVFDEVEEMLGERREELGIRHIFKNFTARGGELSLYLYPEPEDAPDGVLPYSSDEIVDILWELLPGQIPGGQLTVTTGGSSSGNGTRRTGISMRIQGDDAQTLQHLADRLVNAMAVIPNITDVRKSDRGDETEIQLKIDPVLAANAGISPVEVAQTVAFALLGTRISELQQGAREIGVWAQFREEDRQSQANLGNVMLRGQDNTLVALSQLVTPVKAESPRQINRRDGKNYLHVTGTAAGRNIKKVRAELQQIVDVFELPVGYSISLGDEFQNVAEDRANFISVLILAVILIYIVMSALFESYLLPLSILTSVPLAFIGVAWTLYATGTPMDTVAFIGCILMVGVVVNNGIVIVDHINHLRRRGLDRFDAVVQGGRDRLRPVLMTAITTILGAFPLAIGGQIGEPATVSLGRAIIGGLAAGTVLTLIVVPLFYTLIDDFRQWCVGYAADLTSLTRRRKPAA